MDTSARLAPARLDRACGVLLGGAVGDALGAGYEFGAAPLGGAPRMIGGGLGGFAPGEWTDDTAQACAIATVAATGSDLCDSASLDAIAAGFAEWFDAGPPDVGVQTSQVLGAAGRYPTAEAMTATAAALHACTGRTAGNGSLMRTAPVALAHLGDAAALTEAARAISDLTHADPLAAEACVLWCQAIRSTLLTGELTSPAEGLGHLPPSRRDFWAECIAAAEQQPPRTFSPNGFVVTALQAAWSAIVQTPVPDDDASRGSFACTHLRASLHTAIAIGHDTDTVAAIAGALLGARWGSTSVPAEWREVLHGWPGWQARDLVGSALLAAWGGRPDSQGWPGCARVDYADWSAPAALVPHPHDAGVLLGDVSQLDHLPAEVDVVVSLCRVGREQPPEPPRQIDFRLLDTTRDDNPNLAFVIDDAARTVRRHRDRDRVVLLHCVAAQSRTPVVAARYSVLRGRPLAEALTDVIAALPTASPNPVLVSALADLGEWTGGEGARQIGSPPAGRRD